MFTEEKKKELIEILQQRRLTGMCPMCRARNFTIADAYLRNQLQEDLSTLTLGGAAIPSIAIICTNCGFISQHALGTLGLLSQKEDGK